MLELLRKHARLRDLAADESIEWNAMAYEMRDPHRDTFADLRSTTGVLDGNACKRPGPPQATHEAQVADAEQHRTGECRRRHRRCKSLCASQ